MKIVVTGASGFVGSHLVPYLIKQGAEVVALSRRESLPFDCKTQQGDLRDAAFCETATQGADVMIHLAAVMMTSPQQMNDLVSLTTQGTSNLVSACKKNGVSKILYTSSTVALGASLNGKYLLHEDSKVAPKGWFDFLNVKAKRTTEALLRDSGIPLITTYSGLLYGPRDAKKEIRKANLPILKGKMPFYFDGGVNINEVESFIEGAWLALQKGASGSRYVLGGENITNQNFFSMLAKANSQQTPKWKFPSGLLRFAASTNEFLGIKNKINKESVETLLAYHWCESTKAIHELGYKPGSAQIAIQKSIEWMKRHGLI